MKVEQMVKDGTTTNAGYPCQLLSENRMPTPPNSNVHESFLMAASHIDANRGPR